MGYLVKLDTNGSQPEKLHALIDAGLVDMVAMDIKNSPAHYARTVGLPHFDLSPVQQSAAMLMAGSLLAMIPMVILYLIFQKQFIQGIAMTGGK